MEGCQSRLALIPARIVWSRVFDPAWPSEGRQTTNKGASARMGTVELRSTRAGQRPAPHGRLRPGHLLRLHPLIELLAREIPEPQRRLAQVAVFDVSGVGNLRGFVIADLRRQCGHQHQ